MVASCGGDTTSDSPSIGATSEEPPPTSPSAQTDDSSVVSTQGTAVTEATVTTSDGAQTTTSFVTRPATSPPPNTAPLSAVPVPVSIDSGRPSTTPVPESPVASGSTSYVVPVAAVDAAGWGTTHSTYPATDIFVDCGADVVAPVHGSFLEVRRVNSYDPAVDNPATRGGRSITILGDDGVRYYLAHFDVILDGFEPGGRVAAGQPLGTMGDTGRASACHTHFGISPPCPGKEWSVRRGVIWPYGYLDAWRQGNQLSPVEEVDAWVAANPDACATAMADPNAADS
ncbi:MAG: M23 family metallopeptidase [Ilumatobacteraceae bacterium]